MGDNAEEKRTKVYVLTSGQYSDHRVEAVFSTEALAINYAEGVDNVNLPPEEYEVDGLKPTLKVLDGRLPVGWRDGNQPRGKWRDPHQLWQREEIVSGRKMGALHIYLFARAISLLFAQRGVAGFLRRWRTPKD